MIDYTNAMEIKDELNEVMGIFTAELCKDIGDLDDVPVEAFLAAKKLVSLGKKILKLADQGIKTTNDLESEIKELNQRLRDQEEKLNRILKAVSK